MSRVMPRRMPRGLVTYQECHEATRPRPTLEVLGVIHEQLALVEALAGFSATVSREITCSTYIAHAHAQGTHAAHA